MTKELTKKWIMTLVGWVVAILFFFPIFWMTITAFKTEKGAYSPDLIFWPTLESVAPIMVLGWLTQKQLVRGLTFGAVK